jgi:hypothetical protein
VESLRAVWAKLGLRHAVDVRRLHGLPSATAGEQPHATSRLHSTLAETDSWWSAEAVDMLVGLTRLEMGVRVGQGQHEGCSSMLFTAPHGLSVRRDGFAHHKPEDYTTRLAKSFAEALGSSAVVWAEGERCKSEFLKMPDRFNLDPNYLVRAWPGLG